MSIVASIKGSIQITDNLTGSVALSKPVNNSYTGEIFNYGQSVIVGTGTYTVTLPVSPVEFLYVKNLSANAGTIITVTWTPASGSSVTTIVLDPGALIIFSEVTTTNGISALSLVSNQLGTPVEFVLCG
jgi:hypothetical protein